MLSLNITQERLVIRLSDVLGREVLPPNPYDSKALVCEIWGEIQALRRERLRQLKQARVNRTQRRLGVMADSADDGRPSGRPRPAETSNALAHDRRFEDI